MKATFQTSADVALIKYWGKKDERLRLPENGSLSIILEGLNTITTVEFNSSFTHDQIIIEGDSETTEVSRVVEHLNRVRKLAGSTLKARVESKNTFPKGTGLSSSSSGFAALTLAACKTAGVKLSEKELSILARQGSGSACRCVCGGFVEWRDGDTSETSFAQTIFPAEYWDIRDVVAVVDEGPKRVASSEGHQSARSSLFFETRLSQVSNRIKTLKKYIKEKNFEKFGELVEAEALEFHSILLTSRPPLIAWYPGTVAVMLEVQRLRSVGIPAYFTINTGFNVHVLTLPEFVQEVEKNIAKLSLVKKTHRAKIGQGPVELATHLF